MVSFEEDWPKSVKDFHREIYKVKKDAKKRNKRKKFKTQSGLEFDSESVISNVSEHTSDSDDWFTQGLLDEFETIKEKVSMLNTKVKMQEIDCFIDHLEASVIAFYAIANSHSVKVATSIFLLFIKRFCSKSLAGYARDLLCETIGFTEQSGAEFEERPGWLHILTGFKDNWSLLKSNKLFGNISKLMGFLVVSGLCEATDLTFSLGKFKLFQPELKNVHLDALDFSEAVVSTLVYFVENIYLCFRDKSLSPLFFRGNASQELDEEYSTISQWWELVRNGNLEKIANVSESEFDRRLEGLMTGIRGVLPSASGFEKKLIQDKLTRLMNIKNDFITMKVASGVRRAPFVIELFGESSQGKTTCGDQLVDALLRSANLPLSKEYRATYNPSDKFMSNWTTSKIVMCIDDFANEKSQFVERPPTRAIIDICNNQPYYANMADIGSKGKVFVEPQLVVVNTNVKNLDAQCYSNCPYSVLRRMNYILTIQAKACFQHIGENGELLGIDPAKIRRHYGSGYDPLFDDIWEITVERACKPSTMNTISNLYEVQTHKGYPLYRSSFRQVVQFLIDAFAEHRLDQDCIIDRMRSRDSEFLICPGEGCCQIKGYCDQHDELYDEDNGDFKKQSFAEIKTATCDFVQRTLELAHYNEYFRILSCFLPDNYVKILLFGFDTDFRSCVLLNFIIFGVFFVILIPSNLAFRLLFTLFYSVLVLKVLNSYINCILDRRRQSILDRPLFQILRSIYSVRSLKIVGSVSIALTTLYLASLLWRSFKRNTTQGSLKPKTVEEVDERDNEVSPWSPVVKRDLPMSKESFTTTPEQLRSVVSKNLVYASIDVGDQILKANVLFLCSNVMVLPRHYFEREDLYIVFRKKNPEATGGKFEARVHLNHSYVIPGTDLVICYCSTGGSFRDLRKFFPKNKFGDTQFSMVWRSKDGNIELFEGLSRACVTSNGVSRFEGGEYRNLSKPTFRGLCGATLISHGIGTCIIGIHLGGIEGTKRGCFGTITLEQFESGLNYLKSQEGFLITGSAGTFTPQCFGVEFVTNSPLHPKSALNYLPKDSQFEYYGSCIGACSSHSDVRVTPISESILMIMGAPNIYCPPKMKPEWYGWQSALYNAAHPAKDYPISLLNIAVKDYKKPLMDLIRLDMWKSIKPLTDHENLCGIPGKRFMDAIKLDTSIGYPLSGVKRKFVTELEPTLDKPNNRILDPIIMAEIERCENLYKGGERAYPIAKACKKDEILAKEKCRIFYGNSISLTWLIRKYYLPILRFLQMNPLVSECAVGINPMGPEWQEFHDHVLTFGKERILGGDYGQYDQKIPSQLLLASLRIMIDLARECDYTSQDLKIMEALAGDVVYALVAVNGDLIGLTSGMHISGNSLTVILNGICGSLNLRCCYFRNSYQDIFEQKPDFRSAVKLMTYGDDNIGSVSSNCNDFNIKVVADFLLQYGQIYTMPDKSSDILDFLDYSQFEFLKRKSIYCPKRGVHVGALVEKSIFKMLHMYMRGKSCPLTPEMACAVNIDTALREFFNHGENVFSLRQEQLCSVAKENNLAHLCTLLETSYDDLVEEWKYKYTQEGPC